MKGRRGMRLLAGASDERLVALAHAGDEQAFAAIVERYRAPLLRYCSRFVSGAAAEDAVQQTFINAYAALSRDDDSRVPAALRPWLYRIAHNAALNVARDPQAGLDELPEGLDGVERPDEVVAARERFRRVIGAVSALPPKQRQVIVRHAVDGDSHERIATDLGMSAGSIRQLAHRARRTVREAAAALLPGPLLRVLPFGPDAAEVLPAAGGGAVLAKVAVVVVAAGAAGGGAVVAKHDTAKPATAKSHVRPAPVRTPVATPPATAAAPPRAGGGSSSGTSVRTRGGDGSGSSKHGSVGIGQERLVGLLRLRLVWVGLVWVVRVRFVRFGLGFLRLRVLRLGLVRLRVLRLRLSGPGPPAPVRRARARALRARARPARLVGLRHVGLGHLRLRLLRLGHVRLRLLRVRLVRVGVRFLWLRHLRFLRVGLLRQGIVGLRRLTRARARSSAPLGPAPARRLRRSDIGRMSSITAWWNIRPTGSPDWIAPAIRAPSSSGERRTQSMWIGSSNRPGHAERLRS